MKNNDSFDSLKPLLDSRAELYNQRSFIADDPISVPHRYPKKQDIEIAGLFAAVMAWGNRKTIIRKAKELMGLMDESPHDFILHHNEKELSRFTKFVHRTFQPTDVLWFVEFLHRWYSKHDSLETAFSKFLSKDDEHVGPALEGFHHLFFENADAPRRTRKHIPAPSKGASCKRMNMYLRWMVRRDKAGVDFGLWKKISPAQLLCPVDLHVERVAKQLGLLAPKSSGWKATLELTSHLRKMDPADPVKYDFALFGMGVLER